MRQKTAKNGIYSIRKILLSAEQNPFQLIPLEF